METLVAQAPGQAPRPDGSAPARPDAWQAQYRRVAALAYAVRRRCPRRLVLALSVVHPRHWPPPEQRRLMAALAHGASVPLPSWMTLLRHWLWTVAFAGRDLVALAWVRVRCWRAQRRVIRAPVALIMKTWGFGPASLAPPSDFYYGTLPEALRARGQTALVLVGDARGVVDPAFARAVLARGQGRWIPETVLVPIWAPLALAVRQWTTAVALRRLAARSADPPWAAVCGQASLESVRPGAMRQAWAYDIAKAAVTRWRPAAYLTLYEGQPWETLAWEGARAANPRCLTVGYQHTVVMPHALEVLSPNTGSWERAAPDVVLCSGETTRAMLTPGHAAAGTQLVVFGASRRGAAPPTARGPQPGRRVILVLPEGIPEEAQVLFSAAVRLAARLPDHRLIFRSHPVLPFDQVRPHLPEPPERYPNIELSTRPQIAEDFARASAVLYRGTSAVLYAVLHGLKPVFLPVAGLPNADPLFQLTTWRAQGDVAEAEAILRQYAARAAEEVLPAWRTAVDYVEAYARPVDDAAVDRLLEALGFPAAPRP